MEGRIERKGVVAFFLLLFFFKSYKWNVANDDLKRVAEETFGGIVCRSKLDVGKRDCAADAFVNSWLCRYYLMYYEWFMRNLRVAYVACFYKIHKIFLLRRCCFHKRCLKSISKLAQEFYVPKDKLIFSTEGKYF